MWATSQGDRTLRADEAQLVLMSVGYLHDMITSGVDLGEPYQTGVMMFDALQPTQQMAILHEVAHGLLDEHTPLVELTAVREATVYAIFCELESLVQIELDLSALSEPSFDTRERIIRSCQHFENQRSQWDDLESNDDLQAIDDLQTIDDLQLTQAVDFDPPALQCDDIDQWKRVIELLADQVLWDRDFELEEAFADHDPEKIKAIKRYMGINEDYFAVAAPDADSQQYMQLHRELIGLTQNIREIKSSK